MKKLQRGYSAGEIMEMEIPTYEFTGQWKAAIGNPAKHGIWIIWGASGNGKSSLVMQLAKYMCNYGKVLYDSLEEGTGLSLQKSLKRHGMQETRGRLLILDKEPIEQLMERLAKKKSPKVVIIDSFQYSGLDYRSYQDLKKRFPHKLFIFVSHSEGLHPAGRSARRVEFDADVKIMVSCFQATCKSRFLEGPGEPITIWDEGAARAMVGNGQATTATEEPAL
ncbi:ATP-binding protein [bacterium]|nr:ATP-binding protein [bacterium]